MILDIISHPSPNYDERPARQAIDMIVLHYTDMLSAQEALALLCNPAFSVSAHYLINQEGIIYQLVNDHQRAWHAGQSHWQGRSSLNNCSIGIELDNPGHSHGLQPFPPCQMAGLLNLLKCLVTRYDIPLHRILGHSDIAPQRKCDPNILFDWQLLAQHGYGLWPRQAPEKQAALSVLDVQQKLSQIGYDCPQTDILDKETQRVVQAFQRHFTPTRVDGVPNHKLAQIINSLCTA